MAAKKLTPQQQRDRRSKIMLGVLGVVFLGVLAIQVPKFLPHGSSATPPPAPAATTTPATPTALASAGPASSQLTRFTRFASKDPFKAGVKEAAAGASSSTGTTPASTTPAQPKQPAAAKQPQQSPLKINVTQSPPPPSGPMVPAALLKVNGKKTVLVLGAAFPKTSPMFRVVALSQKAIWIQLVAGSLPNGSQTLKIDLGRKVTLQNLTAKTKFVLSMVKPTTAPAPAKAAG